MRVNVVFFALGVWLLQRQAELPPMRYAWALLLVVPALALSRSRTRMLCYAGRTVVYACALGSGFMWAAGTAHFRLADALAREWEGRDIELVGVVASLPQTTE